MRQRHQTGGIKKQRGRWVGMFWADGQHKSRVLGLVKDMTKSAARVEIAKIVAEEQAKRAVSVTWTFGAFIEKTFFPYYSRKWKASSTKGSTKNRIKVHLVEEFNDREITGFQRDELQDFAGSKGGKVFVFDRGSSEMGPEADFRHGTCRRPHRSKSRPFALHTSGSAEAGVQNYER